MRYCIVLAMVLICGNAHAQIEKSSDYWVYVRLEDRSGVTKEDDAGRSKAGDVVAVLPVTPQYTPSEREKLSYMIYKASLTDEQRKNMIEPLIEQDGVDIFGDAKYKTTAYRKYKLDTSKLGIDIKKGLVVDKIDEKNISISVKTEDDFARYERKRKIYAYIQRPFSVIANKIVRPAFAAENVSTINKSGEDYNTLTLWEDDVDGDLVTATTQETAECYDDDGTLTDAVTIDGSTTNATYYLKITVPEGDRHDGTAGSGFVMQGTGNSAGGLIYVLDNYTVVEWVELTNMSLSATNKTPFINVAYSQGVIVRNCLIHDPANKTSTNIVARGINGYLDALWKSNKFYNNIIYNLAYTQLASGYNAYGIICSGGSSLYNNTIYNITNDSGDGLAQGIKVDSVGGLSASSVKNNIIVTISDECIVDVGSNTFATNLTSDATGNITNKSASDQFVSITGGSEDLHLKSGADAIDAGTDLGTGSGVEIDIDGRDRDAEGDTWDIGADEYVAAAGSAPPPQPIIMIF